ncbi:MAG: hypothetical protein U0792_14055 [Gemmataceae bacterium]
MALVGHGSRLTSPKHGFGIFIMANRAREPVRELPRSALELALALEPIEEAERDLKPNAEALAGRLRACIATVLTCSN